MNEVTYFNGKKVPPPIVHMVVKDDTGHEFGHLRRLFDEAREQCHCIRETFSEGPAPGCVSSPWLKVWTFHYSDGTTEQLKQVIEK